MPLATLTLDGVYHSPSPSPLLQPAGSGEYHQQVLQVDDSEFPEKLSLKIRSSGPSGRFGVGEGVCPPVEGSVVVGARVVATGGVVVVVVVDVDLVGRVVTDPVVVGVGLVTGTVVAGKVVVNSTGAVVEGA
jgi:hypothetical protein